MLELERAVEERERSSGEQVQESLKSALLLRSVSNNVRAHISASLDENASYATLRECVLRLERVQFKWNSTNVFGVDVGLFGGRSKGGDQSNSDAVPMEIDRVKGKGKDGKGKGKDGKGKGKGGKAQGQQKGGQQQWNDTWSSKGKGKENGKGKGQQRETRACNVWRKPGHLTRGCWSAGKGKGKVNQVQNEPNSANASGANQAAKPNAPAQGSTAEGNAVRRIQAFNISGDLSFLAGGSVRAVTYASNAREVPEVSGQARSASGQVPEAEGQARSRSGQVPEVQVRDRVQCPSSEHQSHRGAEGNTTCVASCLWYALDSIDRDSDWTVCPGVSSPAIQASCDLDQAVQGCVRAVHDGTDYPHEAPEYDVLLDSGADWSCLPMSFSNHGVDQGGWNLDLSDAQGEPLAIDSMREVEFLLYSLLR